MRRLLIVDLEATCWERHQHDPERMETIEIGALLVDPAAAGAPSEFQVLVRPVRSPVLSAFCTVLTGIRQCDVDAAETFPGAFRRFLAWVETPAAVRLGSWGDYDRRQLLRDCAHHGLSYPFAEDHLNLKHYCAGALGIRPGGLATALGRAGLRFDGRHHRGLDDARNIWRLLRAVTGGSLASLAE